MKPVLAVLITAFCLLLLSAAVPGPAPTAYTTQSMIRFTQDARIFASSLDTLKAALKALQPKDQAHTTTAIEALKRCRIRYKRIESFMEYFFTYPVNLYNRAPVYEVEEPYAEYQSPVGMQVIEDLLLEEEPFNNKKALTDQCEVLAATAADIPGQLYGFKADDRQLLESNRLELVRIIALGITGYDAPQLKTAMPEAAEALRAMEQNLQPLLEPSNSRYAVDIRNNLQKAIALLDARPGYDGFNRLSFLKEAMLPLQEALGLFIAEQELDMNTHDALNHRAANLFSKDAIDLDAFRKTKAGEHDTALAALGRELFFEKALSGNGRRNCATCHQPEKAFTDGLAKSMALDEKSVVVRNAPTLYYAAYQRSQFYDGRAASLEDQIKTVLRNKHEMDASLEAITAWLNNSAHYKPLFQKAAHLPQGSNITIDLAAGALAAYEQSLAPFSSAFDRYMAGDTLALNAQQQQGFNLFMGKAQCGSCHFAPLFNGLVPPYYERSESEVLGVPKTGSRKHPVPDTDSGRYGFFAISFYNGAFKTSTVRNAALTAPYMHNGAFKTLREVVDFYDRGGGKGLKLDIPNQTLSDQPLHLSNKEKRALIAFIGALTDKPAY